MIACFKVIIVMLFGYFSKVWVSGYYTRTGNKILVRGYIYHPQYYHVYQIDGVPPFVNSQTFTQEGDFIIGHYTLSDKNSVMTTVDYAGEPLHGFQAVLSGSEIHSALATVLAKAMSFEPPDNVPGQNHTVATYKVPVLSSSRGKAHAIKGDKEVWVPASKHKISDHKPIKQTTQDIMGNKTKKNS